MAHPRIPSRGRVALATLIVVVAACDHDPPAHRDFAPIEAAVAADLAKANATAASVAVPASTAPEAGSAVLSTTPPKSVVQYQR